MAPSPTGYVSITGPTGRAITVTEKAWSTIYASKDGFDYVGPAAAPPIPIAPSEDDEDDSSEEAEDDFDPPLSRTMRKSVAGVLAWVREGEDEAEIKRRALAVFTREQSEDGRNRVELIEGLGELVGQGA